MFEKRDYRMYKGINRKDIYPKVCDFWSQHGFYVAQLSPFQIRGESYHQRIGLRREFFLRLDEHEDKTYIDLQFNAKITDEGMVGGVAAAVIAWPVALVGGAISYSEYENEANALMYNFWRFVDETTKQTGTVPPGWTPPPSPFDFLSDHRQTPAPPPQYDTQPCKKCGALLPNNWMACPYCGTEKK
jgi:hypothetical protein